MKKLIIPNSSCKALSHWGTNLGSTIGLRMSTQQRNMVGIPLLLSDISIGLLLSGDKHQTPRKSPSKKNPDKPLFNTKQH